jgi:hypothetical protein
LHFFSIKIPIDAADKDSKTYTIKIRKCDMGSPEDFLKLHTTLNENIKNNGFAGKYEMTMNLVQAMLVGSSSEIKKGASSEEKRQNALKTQTTPNLR